MENEKINAQGIQCPKCRCKVIEKRYYSSPNRDYVEYSCRDCHTVIADADTPWHNTRMLTDSEKSFAELFDKRISIIEEYFRIWVADHEDTARVIVSFKKRIEKLESIPDYLNAIKSINNKIEKLKNRMSHLERQVSNAIPQIACSMPDIAPETLKQSETATALESGDFTLNSRIEKLEKLYEKVISDWVFRTKELEHGHSYDDTKWSQDGTVNVTIEAEREAHGYFAKAFNSLACDMESIYKRVKIIEDFIGQNYKADKNDFMERLDFLYQLASELNKDLLGVENDVKQPQPCPVCKPGILNEELAQVAIQLGKELICPNCKGQGNNSTEFEGGLKIKSPCKACDGRGFKWG